MKQFLLVLLAIICLGLLPVGCSDDDEGQPGSP